MKRDTGTLALNSEHDYWKLSGKTVVVAIGPGSYYGSRAGIQSQLRSDLSKVISLHQGDATDETFSSLLTDFSKVLDNLKMGNIILNWGYYAHL